MHKHRWVPSFLRFGLVLCLLAMSSCGFQLRGVNDIAFKSLYLQGQNVSIARDLKRALLSNGVALVPTPEQADLMLEILSESAEKRILSLSGTGRVREFELNYQVNFRIKDPSNELWGMPQTISGRRDFTFDDSQLLAKQGEEARLNDDMRADAVRELMHVLSVQRPKPRTKPPVE